MRAFAGEVFERLLLPVVVAGLAWPAGLALLRRVARTAYAQRDAAAAAQVARRFGVLGDERDFRERFALYRLIDYADLPLAHARRLGWFGRWTNRSGPEWPREGAYLAVTFHFGAGMWTMRELGRHAVGVKWIHAPVVGTKTALERFVGAVGRARIASVAKFAGAPTIPTGGARRLAAEWLARGGAVTALHDAPHFGHRETIAVPFLGQSLHLPTGLGHLAATAQVPVYFYTTSLELDGARRRLRVVGPFRFDSAADFTLAAGRFLDEEVRADPAAWHLWNALDRGFPPPVPTESRQAAAAAVEG